MWPTCVGRAIRIDARVFGAAAPNVAVNAVRLVLIEGFDPSIEWHWQKVGLPHGGDVSVLALDGAVGVKMLARAGLVVVAPSAGEPVVVDADVLAVGRNGGYEGVA